MTAQHSDILINDSDVELSFLRPYFVCSASGEGGDASAFPVKPIIPESNFLSTNLWRGYVATMRLHRDGRLELVKYDYPYAVEGTPPQLCNALFTGDFSITFRPFFYGPDTTIPFLNGYIVRDREKWQVDDQTLSGVVESVFSDRTTNEPHGLLVDIAGRSFVPRSQIPLEFRDRLDDLIGQTLRFSILAIKKGNFILKVEGFEDHDTG
ncbi:hypothetical protein [Aeoliella sp.]|uniref:hypothetical protein n=1 Tax=Aeoliella sp. TaxID=2795800 RepID=UPI003CCBCFFA